MNKNDKILPKIFPTKLQAMILEELLEREDEFFTVSQMARELDVSSSAVSSRISKIYKIGLIQMLPAKRAKIFKLNSESEAVKHLMKFYKKLKESNLSIPSNE